MKKKKIEEEPKKTTLPNYDFLVSVMLDFIGWIEKEPWVEDEKTREIISNVATTLKTKKPSKEEEATNEILIYSYFKNGLMSEKILKYYELKKTVRVINGNEKTVTRLIRKEDNDGEKIIEELLFQFHLQHLKVPPEAKKKFLEYIERLVNLTHLTDRLRKN